MDKITYIQKSDSKPVTNPQTQMGADDFNEIKEVVNANAAEADAADAENIKKDGSVAFEGEVNMGNQKVKYPNLIARTNAQIGTHSVWLYNESTGYAERISMAELITYLKNNIELNL